MAEIKKTDIIDSGINQEVDNITASFTKLISEIDGVVLAGTKLNQSLKSTEATQKNVNTANDKANKNAGKLKESITKVVNVEKTLQKQREQQYRQQQKSAAKTQENIKLINKEAKTLADIKKQTRALTQERDKLDITTKKGKAQLKEYNKRLEDNRDALNNSGTSLEKQRDNIGNYKSAMEGLPGPIGGVTRAFNVLAKNPILLVFTAIVGAVTFLYKALTRSEKGQNKLNKIMAVGSAIIGKLTDYVSNLAELLVDAFTNPKEAIAGLWKFLKSQFLNRIEAMGTVFKSFGDLLKGVFTLDTEKIKSAAKTMGNAYVDSLTGVKNTLDKVSNAQKNLSDELKKSIDLKYKAAILQQSLDKIERKNLVEIAKIEGKTASLRAKAEELKKSNAKESISATKQAQALENEILIRKKTEAELEYEIIKAKNKAAKSDKEDKKAEAEAQAKLIRAENDFTEKRKKDAKEINRLLAERETQLREQFSTEVSLNNEATKTVIANNKTIIESNSSTFDEKQKAIEQNAKAQLDNVAANLQLEKDLNAKYLKEGLISREAYNSEIKKLDTKANNDNAKILDEKYKQEQKIKEKATKDDIKNINKSNIAFVNSQNEQINAEKEKYLNGEISAKDYANKIIDINKGTAEHQIGVLEEMLKVEGISADETLKIQKQITDAKAAMLDKEVQDKKKAEAKKKKIAADTKKTEADLANAAFDLYHNLMDRQLSNLQTQKEYELSLVGNNEEAKNKINDKFAKKAADIKRKQAIADKAQSLFNIAINTAVAVTSALELGPVGIPLAVLMGALGAAQAAVVLAEPLPKFKHGVKDFEGGNAIVGDGGKRELVVSDSGAWLSPPTDTLVDLPKGADVFSGENTARILGSLSVPQKKKSESQNLEYLELKSIRKALEKGERVSVNIDKRGVSTIYGATQQRINRIDKYFN